MSAILVTGYVLNIVQRIMCKLKPSERGMPHAGQIQFVHVRHLILVSAYGSPFA